MPLAAASDHASTTTLHDPYLTMPSGHQSQSSMQTIDVGMQIQVFPPPPIKATKRQKRASGSRAPVVVESSSPPFVRSQSAMSGIVDRTVAHAATATDPPRPHSALSMTDGRSASKSEPIIRSIFPPYNPKLALEHQAYYPTQHSPRNVPQDGVSRAQYSPRLNETSPDGIRSPAMNAGRSPKRMPHEAHGATPPDLSSTEELKELWKVANGWKVSRSEGRRFCMKFQGREEEPVYTLASSTQVFYTLRLDPTSTSAQVTFSRWDPSKTPPKPDATPGSSVPRLDGGVEVIATTLEEKARRLPPNDGLVALLLPIAASRMVVDMASKAFVACDEGSILAAAEKECGRLMWDHDAQKYMLVHPCMSTPFYIAIERAPAWSKVEYTLEHPKLARNLVRLTRDGTGAGYLEFDTGVAAKIDCHYIADVAICGMMLVAIAEEKATCAERFEAPPTKPPLAVPAKQESRWSKKSMPSPKVQEFQEDLESQSSLQKVRPKKKDKVPGFCGLLWMMMRFIIWIFVSLGKGCAAAVVGITRCLTGRHKK